MPLTLKQLRYAIAVADLGHFGRAAEACGVTQPALSQQIQSLENTCGTQLFDRLPRQVQVTPFGAEFLTRARNLIENADAIDAFVAGRSGLPSTPVRFGLIPTVAPYLLPSLFPALTAALPELRFAISESRTETLLAKLGAGQLDLALIASQLPPGGPALTVAPLFADSFVLASNAVETFASPVALESLDPERILLLDEGHCFRDQTIAACRLETETASRTFAATSLSTIVEFVANGQGVTLLPEIALRKEAADPRIRIHPLAAPGAGRVLSLVWRQATPFAALYAAIAAVIRRTREVPAAA